MMITRVLKPEEFNAETMAALYLKAFGSVTSNVSMCQVVLDAMQDVLDQLVARGILSDDPVMLSPDDALVAEHLALRERIKCLENMFLYSGRGG
jgi:hypothetical protein